jgi:transcriptional regulator with XRE-family HTH domain
MPQSSATSRRRELSNALKQLREAANVTVAEAAETLGCSTDKIHWMERADWTNPRWRDVRDLLNRYGVTDEATRDELIDLARKGGEKDWWQPYSKTLSKRRSKYSAYLGLEADAMRILTYQLAVIPGLLQTDDYARAVIAEGPTEIGAKEINERVQVRTERQRILAGEDPVQLWAVIDEAALRRQIGGPDVMRAQIEYLIELAERPHITLQVLPFAAGAHPALSGSFTLLSSGQGYPDVAYVETIGGELLIDRLDGVDRYRQVFRRLNVKALNPEATIEMLVTEVTDT